MKVLFFIEFVTILLQNEKLSNFFDFYPFLENILTLDVALFVLISCGALAGLLNGWLGLGGMSIFMPLLIWVAHHGGWGPDPAVPLMLWIVANSIGVMFLNGLVSVSQYARDGMIEKSAITWTAPFAVIGAIVGISLALLSGVIGEADKIFGGYLILIGLFVFLDRSNQKVYVQPGVGTKITVGSICGFAAGLIGFNGNSLLIPAMKHSGLCSKSSIATSQVIGLFVSLALLLTFFGYSAVKILPVFNLPLILVLGVSSSIFSWVGAYLKKKMSTSWVTVALSICYIIAGANLVLEGTRIFLPEENQKNIKVI
ncbi:MAG TPA: sulfite exporter TauE/SafE family protein, partial [Ignavibacteriaceae bacterium]